MKQAEIESGIGKVVIVNASRDIGINPYIRRIIGKDSTLVKRCRSGLLQVECEGKLFSVPMTNVDLKPEVPKETVMSDEKEPTTPDEIVRHNLEMIKLMRDEGLPAHTIHAVLQKDGVNVPLGFIEEICKPGVLEAISANTLKRSH